jgi:hypothetical protein
MLITNTFHYHKFFDYQSIMRNNILESLLDSNLQNISFFFFFFFIQSISNLYLCYRDYLAISLYLNPLKMVSWKGIHLWKGCFALSVYYISSFRRTSEALPKSRGFARLYMFSDQFSNIIIIFINYYYYCLCYCSLY